MVLAYRAMTGDAAITSQSSFGPTDVALLDTLKEVNKRPDIQQLLKLKSRIGTGNKKWVESFIAAQGIPTLLNAMDKILCEVPIGELDASILYEMVSCSKIIMNNGVTLIKFIETSGAIRIITQCLIFEWKPLALLVLEVLSVICDYSNDAASQVVKYLRYVSRMRREAPFAMLVDAMIDEDVDVKAGVIVLINGILGGIDDLGKRMAFRGELKALRFGLVCDLAIDNLDEDLRVIQMGNITNDNLLLMPSTSQKIRETLHKSDPHNSYRISKPEDNSRSSDLDVVEEAATNKFRRRSQVHAKHPSLNKRSLLNIKTAVKTLYAEDGVTVIDPQSGLMSGLLETEKNRSSGVGSILKELGSKMTKHRWFSLTENSLSWWMPDAKRSGPPSGTIDTIDIIKVNGYSSCEELKSAFTFDVITHSRAHSFGCATEELKDRWLTALSIIRDKMQLKKFSYSLQPSALDSKEFEMHSTMFRKQVIVYEAIVEDDQKHCISSSGIDVSSAIDISRFLHCEMSAIGLGDRFVLLLQELLIVPTDSEFGDMFWENLIRICRDMRGLRRQCITDTNDKIAVALGSYKLDTESCLRLLKKKERSASGKAVSELNKQTLEIFTKNEEIDRLKKEIAQLRNDTGVYMCILS